MISILESPGTVAIICLLFLIFIAIVTKGKGGRNNPKP